MDDSSMLALPSLCNYFCSLTYVAVPLYELAGLLLLLVSAVCLVPVNLSVRAYVHSSTVHTELGASFTSQWSRTSLATRTRRRLVQRITTQGIGI